MTREEKTKCFVTYLTNCGMSEEKAVEKALPIIDNGDYCSLFARKCNYNTREWNVIFVENFTCLMEYLGWKKEHSKELKNRGYYQTLFLNANDPFYNSEWRNIPEHCIQQCCIPVQKRAKQGL